MHTLPTTLTVAQLNKQVRSWLEYDLGEVRVAGELSNLSKPSSGHLYFTLKDSSAQLRCVFFRNYHNKLITNFEDGQQVIATGKLSLYEARGEYQLIVQELIAEGVGALYQQFEQLKTKLDQQGLFLTSRKKPLVRYPLTIGIITSSTSAALRDILITLAKRYPIAHLYIYHCEVQGKTASLQLINALRQANQDAKVDVILLARGGGSIEDLWAFNDEQLAITISQSKIPIISGIGHETDFTIADFVADFRAATPTAAAQAATPDRMELLDSIDNYKKRIEIAVLRLLKHLQLVLSHHENKLVNSFPVVASLWQKLDYLERQLYQNLLQLLQKKRHKSYILLTQLQSRNPTVYLRTSLERLNQIKEKLLQLMRLKINSLKQQFNHYLSTLEAVSPLSTLNRGYAIVTKAEIVILSNKQVNPNDMIKIKLADGNLHCKVVEKDNIP